MPSEKPTRRILDIIDNATAIERYLAHIVFHPAHVAFREFERDQNTRDAVERCLKRISKASSKLGDLAEEDAGTAVAQHSRFRQPLTP